MKAAVQEQAGQPMVIKNVPDPSPKTGEVLVKVGAASVCHTDLHIADGDFSAFGYNPYPLIMGHEIVGVVEQVGEGVANFSPGDRVGVHWILACGKCPYCQMGEEESCLEYLNGFKAIGLTRNGGYAEYLTTPARRLIPLPPALDFVDAAPLFCAGLTMYGGFRNGDLRPGQRVAVLGVGGLGHLGIQIAKAMGAEVIAVTASPEKIELAKQLGASEVITGTDPDWGKKLMGMGGANLVISTTVNAKTIAPAMEGLLPQGTLVLAGLTLEPIPVVPFMLLVPQTRVIGTNVGSSKEQRELLQLVVEHNIRPITETYKLDEVNAVHQRLRNNQVRFRAVLTPN